MSESSSTTLAALRAELLGSKKLLQIAGQDQEFLGRFLDSYGDALPEVGTQTLWLDLMQQVSMIRDAKELATPAQAPTADFVRPRGATM